MTQCLCIIRTGNYLSIEFYEDKLRSKHLTTHCLFSLLEIHLHFLFVFGSFWRFGMLEDGTLQKLPLNKETGFHLSAFRWRLSFGFSAGVGMLFPYSFFFCLFPTHLRWNPVALPLPCHSCSFGLPPSCALCLKTARSLVPSTDAGGIFFIMFDFPAFHVFWKVTVLCLCLGGYNKNTIGWMA